MSLNRPLSPHLSIHKKVLTAVFSIFHRFTGISLSIGSILIALWFCLFALLPSYYFVFEIISANIFVIVKPRPVPPNFLVVLSSACVNGLNILST